MEYDKINNLLLSEDNESEQLSKFVTREYVRVNNDFIYASLDPSFQGVKRLFVMGYNKIAAANDNQFNRNSRRVYYLPRNDLKKYNVIID